MTLRFSGILLLLLAVWTWGCSRSNPEQGDIRKVLNTRATALNARALPAYLSVISSRYNDKGRDFAGVRAVLEKNFADFEQIAYTADTAEISVSGTQAEAVSSYRMKVSVKGKELDFAGKERLRLVKEADGWKIIAGI